MDANVAGITVDETSFKELQRTCRRLGVALELEQLRPALSASTGTLLEQLVHQALRVAMRIDPNSVRELKQSFCTFAAHACSGRDHEAAARRMLNIFLTPPDDIQQALATAHAAALQRQIGVELEGFDSALSINNRYFEDRGITVDPIVSVEQVASARAVLEIFFNDQLAFLRDCQDVRKTVQERLSPTHLNTLFIEPQTGGSELFSAASSAMQPLVDARLDAIAAQRGVLDRHLELLMKASPETIVAFAEAEEARKFQGSLGPTLAKRLEELRVTLGVMRAANIEGFASWKAERFHPDLRQTIVSLTGCFFSEIPSIAEPHSDIALTLQKIFERTVLHAVQSGH